VALIHLDAGVVIGLLDANDTHHDSARAAVAAAFADGSRLAMAASALAECLVGPSRHSKAAVRAVHDFVERMPLTIVPLDASIATIAADLRAKHPSLRLPDALVIATALDQKADELVMTDRRWPKLRGLHLAVTTL
jgi:predicted nucleic acid-binding protein